MDTDNDRPIFAIMIALAVLLMLALFAMVATLVHDAITCGHRGWRYDTKRTAAGDTTVITSVCEGR